MPEVQEVFRMATQKVRPDPGALERQQRGQRRRTVRRKMTAIGSVAALVAVAALFAVRIAGGTREQVPLDQGSSSTPGTEAVKPVGFVTFDGSTCSLELTDKRIEPGVALFTLVNATEQRAVFDSYELVEGFTIRSFDAGIARVRRGNENGKPGQGFPEAKSGPSQEVRYLGSELVPANSTGSLVLSTYSGKQAIVCLKPYEGLGLGPFGIVGPITIG